MLEYSKHRYTHCLLAMRRKNEKARMCMFGLSFAYTVLKYKDWCDEWFETGVFRFSMALTLISAVLALICIVLAPLVKMIGGQNDLNKQRKTNK